MRETVVVWKELGIAALTLGITAFIALAGLSGKKILFLEGPRTAAIALGAIGMAFCAISVGRFINASPVHPLTILGYLLGAVALVTFLGQIFGWKLPFVAEPRVALIVLAGVVFLKTVIGRFAHFIG